MTGEVDPDHGRGPAGASLGTYGERNTPPLPPDGVRQGRRASKTLVKLSQRRITVSVSSRFCQWPTAALVNVDIGPQRIAHVGGIARCGSPWSCPICAPVVRERRAIEIELACLVALSQGMGVEMVAVTVPHRLAHKLAPRLGECSTALAQILKGAPWERRKESLGYFGAIRSVEVTWSTRNGWHPHIHALMFFERPLTDDERQDLRDWMSGRWATVCKRKNLGTLHAVIGVDLRQVTSGGGEVGEYLTKMDNGWNPAREIARGDLKKSDHGSTPWDILTEFARTESEQWRNLWQEYERATLGKRAIVWSPGLRSRLLGTEDTPTDIELAASEGADVETLVRYLIAAPLWIELQRNGTAAEFLDRCEDFAGHVIEEHSPTAENPYEISVNGWSSHA